MSKQESEEKNNGQLCGEKYSGRCFVNTILGFFKMQWFLNIKIPELSPSPNEKEFPGSGVQESAF